MILKSFGCSFILGTDLPDLATPDQFSSLTWPSLLARKFDLPYRCYAGGGHGNLSILDRLSQEIQHDPSALFVIQWTYIDRFDYSDPNGHHYNKGMNDWLTILPETKSTHAEFFFRNIQSEYRDKLTSLLYIKTAIDLLRENNCRFLMTAIDRLVLCPKYHASDVMKLWQRYLISNLVFFDEHDFLTWSKLQGFAMGETGHPLEQAHAAAAHLMSPVIGSILRKV